jgi:hypothetical protein
MGFAQSDLVRIERPARSLSPGHEANLTTRGAQMSSTLQLDFKSVLCQPRKRGRQAVFPKLGSQTVDPLMRLSRKLFS